MNLYAHDLSLFDFANFDGPFIDPISISSSQHHLRRFSSSSSLSSSSSVKSRGRNHEETDGKAVNPPPRPKSPPRHRHDGTSPLPLGMDWSLPPRKWDGRDTVWPHDPQTGWSYCVTIPSWVLIPKSRGSDPVAFYRVQVGIQSPEGITITRGVLRRFSDFTKLFSELKNAFPQKVLPATPSKGILRTKSRIFLEERRCSLEDWMEKLLSDIDISRSAPIGTFLELESAARAFFNDVDQENLDAYSSVSGIVPSVSLQANSDISALAGSSSIASDTINDFPDDMLELGDTRHRSEYSVELGLEASGSEHKFNRNYIVGRFSGQKIQSDRKKSIIGGDKVVEDIAEDKSSFGGNEEYFPQLEYRRMDALVQRQLPESIEGDISSVRTNEISNSRVGNFFGDDSLDLLEGAEIREPAYAREISNLQFSSNLVVAFPLDEDHKFNRVLSALRQRLDTAKTDMEDLIARFNQEIAARQFLTTKVKDLEVDLEMTRNNCNENMQQAVLNERERYTQMQWDVEELRRQCLELELKLKSEQGKKENAETAKGSLVQENKMLLQQLDAAKIELENLQKYVDELELKSKADVKLLVKEVKSLRSSQSELKQELSRLVKEKLEVERVLQKEKQRMECVTTTNVKLLHEYEILHNRLQECSVNFLIEEENKLVVDTSSPSDAIDLLATSDNRIGLLLAEAQLLAQDVENSVARSDDGQRKNGGDRGDELRKMLAEVFIDNARLRMQVNSVIRCALSSQLESDEDGDQEDVEAPLTDTVLSKLLEK